MKKNLAIVFGITSNLTFALANVIIGLKKHSPNLADEIIVYHDGIINKDQELLNSILPCRFIEYEFPVKDISNFDPCFFDQFSHMAYSRFECFNLLNEFKKVIWLDVDILIQKDISGLLQYSETGFGILPGDRLKYNLKEPIKEYDMESHGYWTGTIIISDKLVNYEKMTKWCYEKLQEYSNKLYLPDQAIIIMLIISFNIEILEIEKAVYCSHPIFRNVNEAVIVHSYRPKKFWDCWKFNEWDANNKNWLKMGGSPYKGKRCGIVLRTIERKFPGAPNPIRKPRDFVKFLWMVKFNNPWIKMNLK